MAVLSTAVSLIWIIASAVAALTYDLAAGRNPQKPDPKVPSHKELVFLKLGFGVLTAFQPFIVTSVILTQSLDLP